MADNVLTKEVATNLLEMKKIPTPDYKAVAFPDMGGRIVVPLQSEDGREKFLFDIT